MSSIVFRNVSFGYDSSRDGILAGVSLGVSEGWTGIIGANGSGKTTILRLACGEIDPREGTIARPARSIYCPQRTDGPMDAFSEFLEDASAEAYRIRGRLGIEEDWGQRWTTLSHGERKRAQIGTCLWLEPELLAVDEPTNHLDRAASEHIRKALRSYRSIGLLVSHDRELLDELCTHSLFVAEELVVLRSGGYTTARAAVLEENRVAREVQSKARYARRALEKERVTRKKHQQIAEKAKSLRGANPRDSDARQKAYAARNTDGGAGKRLRQLEGRIRHAQETEDSIRLLKVPSLGISVEGRGSQRNTLLRIDGGSLPLGEERELRFDELIMLPADRVGIAGPNGSGKSTLVRHILDRSDMAEQEFVYIPQEIDAEASSEILDEVRGLSGEELGRAMTWVSRLGSDPARLLESRVPSPGEVRKLLLAMHIARLPNLIIMDEPTNHMDLPSIECVESALRDFPGGLLLVSHDQRFLSALTTLRWRTVPDGLEEGVVRLVRETATGVGPETGAPTMG